MHALLPDAATLLAVLPLALGWAVPCALFASWLRTRRDVRTPYTRKTFHFLIIAAAALVQLRWGVAGTVVYGATAALLVLYTVLRGPGFPFYEAIARPSDEPHRTRFVLVPLATTALGGLLVNLFWPAAAPVAYLAVAVGDAIGEPVGTRWGRHRYRVRSLAAAVPATRSLEGSAAVLLATAAAATLLLAGTGHGAATALLTGAVVGVVTALVEAGSPHGLDNLTIQLAAGWVAWLLL